MQDPLFLEVTGELCPIRFDKARGLSSADLAVYSKIFSNLARLCLKGCKSGSETATHDVLEGGGFNHSQLQMLPFVHLPIPRKAVVTHFPTSLGFDTVGVRDLESRRAQSRC